MLKEKSNHRDVQLGELNGHVKRRHALLVRLVHTRTYINNYNRYSDIQSYNHSSFANRSENELQLQCHYAISEHIRIVIVIVLRESETEYQQEGASRRWSGVR